MIMKNRNFSLGFLLLASSLFVSSCSNDPEVQTVTVTETVDSSLPIGDLTVSRSGDLTAESGTPTKGLVEFGVDTKGTDFVHFGSDFTTELGTGTVGIFLSTSEVYTADPANGNPDLRLIGSVQDNGEMFIKLDDAPDAKFTHIILWCATANIPFGNAELK
jgi:hypothetical protein